MSSFLEDIEAENHALLLEKGNLLPKRKAYLQEHWHFDGYKATINRNICRCGSMAETLQTLLLEEKSTLNNYRAINLVVQSRYTIKQFLDSPHTRKSLQISNTHGAVCPVCLPSLGFIEDSK